ncbi:adipocyte plasma membrane-associated protein-like [Littorina saxatilis]|uniref:Strictosidine synthase conserved region domain-containing protein n=1 Tax=Littorina saxatilis TaxID=31220 RepID=A0AAN9GC26_9CAEN
MAATAGMAGILANMRVPDGVNPITVNLPKPPRLEGALAPNSFLSKAVRFADNMIAGPESMVVVNGYVYTGLSDGWVVEINPRGQVRRIRRMSMPSCGRSNAPEDACGRPLGIRADPQGYLVVADAYNGIFRINPVTGQYRQLVFARSQRVNNKTLGFINDLAVARDGTIFFTSSSTKWTRNQYLEIILEGETSGRVLVYNPRSAPGEQVQELVTNLNFPNGLELSADESYLLIAEAARARIFKAYIGQSSPKRGQIETFAENLPGFVDNVRKTPRGSYWVGLSSVRSEQNPSVLDEYGDQPNIRGAIMGLPRDQVMARAPKYAIAVELNQDGNIIRSLHDPKGTLYTSVSELQEEGDSLYIGSFERNFIGILKLSDLPAPVDPTSPAEVATTTVAPPLDGSSTPVPQDPVRKQLEDFLKQIQERLIPMNKTMVDNLVLALVEQLVNAKLAELDARKRVTALEQEVSGLRAQLGIDTTTPSIPSDTAGTTAASGTTIAQPGTTAAGGGAATTPSSAGATTPAGGSATTAQAATGGTTQAGASGTTPAAASGTTPAAASGTTPAAASDTTPAAASGTTQVAASGTTQPAASVTTQIVGDTTTSNNK